MEIPDRKLTERVIGCAYSVHNALGAGFLEKVYENALAVELAEQGLEFGSREIRQPIHMVCSPWLRRLPASRGHSLR